MAALELLSFPPRIQFCFMLRFESQVWTAIQWSFVAHIAQFLTERTFLRLILNVSGLRCSKACQRILRYLNFAQTSSVVMMVKALEFGIRATLRQGMYTSMSR